MPKLIQSFGDHPSSNIILIVNTRYVFQNKFACHTELPLTGGQLSQIVDAALEIEEFQECSEEFRAELKLVYLILLTTDMRDFHGSADFCPFLYPEPLPQDPKSGLRTCGLFFSFLMRLDGRIYTHPVFIS